VGKVEVRKLKIETAHLLVVGATKSTKSFVDIYFSFRARKKTVSIKILACKSKRKKLAPAVMSFCSNLLSIYIFTSIHFIAKKMRSKAAKTTEKPLKN
jgi:hypothetical protein